MRILLMTSVLALTLLLSACSDTPPQTSGSGYFDLKDYFSAEAKRLQAANPTIRKTVSIDGSSEQKQIQIKSWVDEFSAFVAADINKAAWKGMYTVDRTANTERYTATTDKVPVQSLIVKRSGPNVTAIEVTIKTQNTLYTSTEQLNYYPDSLYELNKIQAVRFKALKTYKVNGVF